MICPNCGREASFSEHGCYFTEPHGERHYQQWLECRGCGAKTNDAELMAANQEVEA